MPYSRRETEKGRERKKERMRGKDWPHLAIANAVNFDYSGIPGVSSFTQIPVPGYHPYTRVVETDSTNRFHTLGTFSPNANASKMSQHIKQFVLSQKIIINNCENTHDNRDKFLR